MRCRLSLSSAMLMLTALPCIAHAWPASPQTISFEVTSADVVLFGTLCRSTPPNPSAAQTGVTDFLIQKHLKTHPLLHHSKKLLLPFHVPEVKDKAVPYLVCGRVVRGKLYVTARHRVRANSDLLKYITMVLMLQKQNRSRQARFYLENLRHVEERIADDALAEVQGLSYVYIREAAEKMNADKLRAWIKDPTTPGSIIGLSALLLAHCSRDRTNDFHRVQELARKIAASGNSQDCLKAMVVLRPKEGWKQILTILETSGKEATGRDAALGVTRFLLNSRRDLIPRNQLLTDILPFLAQADLAAETIDFLREGECWRVTGRVLSLANRPSHATTAIREAIIAFALCSPHPDAKAFLAQERRRNSEGVRHAEWRLK